LLLVIEKIIFIFLLLANIPLFDFGACFTILVPKIFVYDRIDSCNICKA